MAVTYVDTHSATVAADTTVTVTAPDGIQDNDILVGYCWSYATGGSSITNPAGFTTWESRGGGTDVAQSRLCWKRASGESGNYAFTASATALLGAHIIVLRGCLTSGDPKDVTSNTLYTTSDTAVRAASMTTTASGAQVWAGYCRASTPTLTVPADFTLASTVISGNGRCTTGYRLDAASAVWGSTGNQDGTSSASTSTKHAFMVSIQAAAPGFVGLIVTRQLSGS